MKVKGEHFGTARGTSKVTFNGEPAISRKWDDDKITVNVPAGARTGPVVVDGRGSGEQSGDVQRDRVFSVDHFVGSPPWARWTRRSRSRGCISERPRGRAP